MVRVGLGVIIVNQEGKILIKKRIGSHAPFYSIPGGHLEEGETFESGAVREIEEETGLIIKNPKVIAITNNLRTFEECGKHYVSIGLLATDYEGQLENREPEKCEELIWVDPENLPQPHFDASAMCVACYLKNVFYL